MVVTALVGHERRGSRTRLVAEEAARQVAEHARGDGLTVSTQTVDLSELMDRLPAAEAADRAREQVASSDFLLVASPTYKGTYTGVLKLFLDGYRGAALSGRVAVPAMLAGAAHHALAADLHLRPLLLELGATCPTPALFLLEREVDERRTRVGEWAESAWPAIAALVGTGAQ